MTLRDLDALAPFDLQQALHTPHGHAHFWERAMSRRGFFGTAVGAAAALAGATALKPLRAWGDDGAEPRPIPGGFTAGGVGWHVNGPSYNNGDDPSSGLPDQSTIFDFAGDVACAVVRGSGIGRQGGVALPLAFDSDMRFMKGRYIGVDGRLHTGTFGFIWLDVYAGQVLGPGVPQIHDYNPGITANGVFWTIRVPDDAVRVNRRTGSATYAMSKVRLDDYYNLVNAFAGGPSTPAIASFRTTFSPVGKVYNYRDEANRFSVRYRDAKARLSWSAQSGGFAYASDPIGTSVDTFAMIGTERNGKFFR